MPGVPVNIRLASTTRSLPRERGTRAYSLRRGNWRGTGEERTADTEPHRQRPRAALPSPAGFLLAVAGAALLAGCATQGAGAVAPEAPGFPLGLWHGFIFPVAWILSLFMPEVAIYAVPNNGGWYDFGYFLGIVVIGVGARKTRVVRERVVVRKGEA